MSGQPEPRRVRPRTAVLVGVVVFAIILILAQAYVVPASSGFKFSVGRAAPTAEPERISRASAASVLRKAVALAKNDDQSGLCDFEVPNYRSNCRNDVQTLDRVTISDPDIVGFRIVHDGVRWGQGAVLEICMKVDGQPLYSEFYVIERPDGGLVPMQAVYWIQRLVQQSGNAVQVSAPAARSSMKFDPRCGPIITEADLTSEAGTAPTPSR